MLTCSSGQTRCVETRAAVGLLTAQYSDCLRRRHAGKPEFPYFQRLPKSGNPPTCSSQPGQMLLLRRTHSGAPGFSVFPDARCGVLSTGTGRTHHALSLSTFTWPGITPTKYLCRRFLSLVDSMTRLVHRFTRRQGVTLARNVGYLSIGHGYYLEDGTEAGNLVSIAIWVVMARAAVDQQARIHAVPRNLWPRPNLLRLPARPTRCRTLPTWFTQRRSGS